MVLGQWQYGGGNRQVIRPAGIVAEYLARPVSIGYLHENTGLTMDSMRIGFDGLAYEMRGFIKFGRALNLGGIAQALQGFIAVTSQVTWDLSAAAAYNVTATIYADEINGPMPLDSLTWANQDALAYGASSVWMRHVYTCDDAQNGRVQVKPLGRALAFENCTGVRLRMVEATAKTIESEVYVPSIENVFMLLANAEHYQ